MSLYFLKGYFAGYVINFYNYLVVMKKNGAVSFLTIYY